MKRLIDAEQAEKVLSEYYHHRTDTQHQALREALNKVPTVDAEPVRHGKWIRVSPAKIYECSVCGQNVCTGDIECYRFCHQCGARMDKENERHV